MTYDDDPSIEPHTIQILCIHHKTTPIGTLTSLQQFSTYIINADIPIQVAPPTPPNTKVNHHKLWSTLPNPPSRSYDTTNISPLPNYTFALPSKYPPEYSYYTNGSFFPPKQISPNNWRPKMASYGIFNPIKDLQISE